MFTDIYGQDLSHAPYTGEFWEVVAWGLSTMAPALVTYKKAASDYKKEIESKPRTEHEIKQLEALQTTYYDAFLGFLSQYMFPAFAEVEREMFMRKQ